MSGIWLTGLNELTVQLGTEAVEAPVRARVVVQESCKKVKETMRSFAPVSAGTDDDDVHMRDTITYTTKLLPFGAEGEVGPTATRDGFPYPAAVEWGTSKMAPQAFAGPALDRHSGEFEERIADGVVRW